MKNKTFGEYLSLYFTDYLVTQRNCSKHTVDSYKYTFKLLLNYITKIKCVDIKKVDFSLIDKQLIKDFLIYLENEKGNSIITRNMRLATIKSFYQYVNLENLENLKNTQDILNIKLKKYCNKEMDYLTVSEIKDLFDSIDITNKKGRRDLVLLTLMYDSAIRVSETTNIKVSDLTLEDSPYITVLGKGNKYRTIPITKDTRDLLIKYIDENKMTSSSYLFRNAKYEKLNTRTIEYIVTKYNTTTKNISPHSLRHSRAVHLLESGVDIVYIRDILGHTSVTTTEIYAKVSIEYKKKMLSKVNSNVYSVSETFWNQDENILEELLNF